MDIAGTALKSQYDRTSTLFPFITQYEKDYKLPQFLLYAVASRETNMTNEVGDGGHGHGMFQLDDRWHKIPDGFDSDVNLQAKTAANMLQGLINVFPGDLKAAVSSYNTGVNNARAGIHDTGNSDAYTAGGDYGGDVLGRMQYLQNTQRQVVNPPPPPTTIPQSARYYTVVSGDTLSSIASRFHTTWPVLYRANRSVVGSNPNVIIPGERLIIPGTFVTSHVYRVKSGDTLSSIAAEFHTTWEAIYDANRDKISNPNLIYPNEVLVIP